MRILKISTLILLGTILLFSCKKEEKIKPNVNNEIENLQLIKSFTESDYTIELFNNSGQLRVGYNKIYLRLKDHEGDYIKQSDITWLPMMHMNMGDTTHQHSCPFSDVKKVSGKETLFEGYIVFIMETDGPDHFWELSIQFTANGQTFEINEEVNVISTTSEYSKVYTSGMGTDGKMYMMALVEPTNPKIGQNDIVVGLFQKGENDNFPIVNNYALKVDPRMPGMGNHSAPGNEDLIQGADGFYHGKVGFSMSGYWKMNFILLNENQEIIKGEEVTDENLESSLNLKLEF